MSFLQLEMMFRSYAYSAAAALWLWHPTRARGLRNRAAEFATMAQGECLYRSIRERETYLLTRGETV